jgi:hypothetical protein
MSHTSKMTALSFFDRIFARVAFAFLTLRSLLRDQYTHHSQQASNNNSNNNGRGKQQVSKDCLVLMRELLEIPCLTFGA